MTLTVIERYLDFKLGEVWSEVVEELEKEGVRPVTPDREALEAVSRTLEERAIDVMATQRKLLETKENQDLLDEQVHYAEVGATKIICTTGNMYDKIYSFFILSMRSLLSSQAQ